MAIRDRANEKHQLCPMEELEHIEEIGRLSSQARSGYTIRFESRLRALGQSLCLSAKCPDVKACDRVEGLFVRVLFYFFSVFCWPSPSAVARARSSVVGWWGADQWTPKTLESSKGQVRDSRPEVTRVTLWDQQIWVAGSSTRAQPLLPFNVWSNLAQSWTDPANPTFALNWIGLNITARISGCALCVRISIPTCCTVHYYYITVQSGHPSHKLFVPSLLTNCKPFFLPSSQV